MHWSPKRLKVQQSLVYGGLGGAHVPVRMEPGAVACREWGGVWQPFVLLRPLMEWTRGPSALLRLPFQMTASSRNHPESEMSGHFMAQASGYRKVALVGPKQQVYDPV